MIDRWAQWMRGLGSVELRPLLEKIALTYLASPAVPLEYGLDGKRLIVAPMLPASVLVPAAAALVHGFNRVVSPGVKPDRKLLVQRGPSPPRQPCAREAKSPSLKGALSSAVFPRVPPSRPLPKRLLAAKALASDRPPPRYRSRTSE